VLERDVVVLVEIVEPDDLVAAFEQVLRRVCPMKPAAPVTSTFNAVLQ
jgi:hypothetical protein